MTTTLLGGIGLTHLTVYHDVPGPDGVHGGCAHIHALTPEAYFGVSGEGAIELHDHINGFRRQTIKKGTFVQFPPGTLHRSISTDHLEVVAVMGNGGLAERGDARIYFGVEVDETPGEYERLRDLVGSGSDGARERRDISALAYAKLLELWNTDKASYFAELVRFFEVHRKSIAENSDKFQSAIEDGPVNAGHQALSNLAALTSKGAVTGFETATSEVFEKDPVFGMCGTLNQVVDLRSV
jgi:mannose-6-phosphate isomerase-like protein (cupin superfamily)